MSPLDQGLHDRALIGAAAPRRPARPSREHVGAAQRLRLISAMSALAADDGSRSTTIAELVSYAGVSRKTFYELFEDRNDCLLAAIEHALSLAAKRAAAAHDSGRRWVDRMRAGLTALLEFFDEEPQLARLCVLQSAAAGPAALARRVEVLDELARKVDEGRDLARRQPPPLTAEGIVGGVLTVIGTRLVNSASGPLIDLVNPLMSGIVLPYRGNAAARKELVRRNPADRASSAGLAASAALEGLPMRVTHRTMAVLAAIAAESGLSNFQVSERVGITDQGQISRLLARLSQLGLTENTGGGQALGAANAWRLTPRGEEVEETIRHSLLALAGNGTRARSMTVSGS
jgi:AcrR family transcriptional regulator